MTDGNRPVRRFLGSRPVVWGGLAIIVALALVLLLRGGTRPPTAETEAPGLERHGDRIVVPEGSPYRKRLVVATVATQPLRRPLDVPAIVEADPARTAKVLPALGGRIVDLKVALGDHVAEGQPLAVIESPDLAQAYDDDAKAQSALELTRKAFERQRGVTGIGAGAEKDLEAARDAFTQTEAEYRRTQARLKALGQFADVRERSPLLTVRAPVTGSVTELDIAMHGYINDPTQSLMTISQLDLVWVTASVAEKDVDRVRADQQAVIRFTAFPRESFTAPIHSISDILEPDTRRLKVRIAFENPAGRVKPNMFATVTLMRTEIPQLVLPTSALLMNNDNTTVFVEVAPWTFVRRTVETEYQLEDVVTIAAGLNLGERVLVRGGVLLND